MSLAQKMTNEHGFVNIGEYLSKVMAHLGYTSVNTMTNKIVCKLCDNFLLDDGSLKVRKSCYHDQ